MHFVMAASDEDGDSRTGTSEPKPFLHFGAMVVYGNFCRIY